MLNGISRDIASFLHDDSFSILTEIEPSRRPDIARVRQQIEVLAPVCDGFLVPDNHLGRATVSSVAIAHEVSTMGGLPIACLNARDRNLLGFRRDLLTAAAYGVEHFLFVYGDAPREGRRTEDLTVRGMIDEVRSFGTGALFEGYPSFKVGAVTKRGRSLGWRRRADFIFVQISYDLPGLIRWREGLDMDCKIYAGVLVLGSSRMARRINAAIPDIQIPEVVVDKLDDDPCVGLDLACEQIRDIRDSGAFDGIHLVPAGRHRDVAERLQGMGL